MERFPFTFLTYIKIYQNPTQSLLFCFVAFR